jgi:diaminopimelate decarboxylase
MDPFSRRDSLYYAENISTVDLAEKYGTPCYVYSRRALEQHLRAYQQGLAGHDNLVCYSVKANSNLAVLNVLARLGAGFDIVSGGELERVIAAGGDPAKVVFSGVAKTAQEMKQALVAGIHCFNVESEAELLVLDRVATDLGSTANVSLRVNPDVDARTHPYIATGLKENKFGIAIAEAVETYQTAQQLSGINIKGIDCHIGSQLTEIEPFIDALDRVLLLVDELDSLGIVLEHLDIGGGLGVRYQDETPPAPDELMAALLERLGSRKLTLILEPGRSIAANAGILLTRVQYLKETPDKNFALVDAAMNDMIRPSLYQAWLNIEPAQQRTGTTTRYDVVGPVCETGDFLGKDRDLVIEQGDLLVVESSGAYGFSMSSNYNSRGRAAEVMVDGDKSYLVRQRETIEDLLRGESLLPGR